MAIPCNDDNQNQVFQSEERALQEQHLSLSQVSITSAVDNHKIHKMAYGNEHISMDLSIESSLIVVNSTIIIDEAAPVCVISRTRLSMSVGAV
jgi:hypothetical protein